MIREIAHLYINSDLKVEKSISVRAKVITVKHKIVKTFYKNLIYFILSMFSSDNLNLQRYKSYSMPY